MFRALAIFVLVLLASFLAELTPPAQRLVMHHSGLAAALSAVVSSVWACAAVALRH